MYGLYLMYSIGLYVDFQDKWKKAMGQLTNTRQGYYTVIELVGPNMSRYTVPS